MIIIILISIVISFIIGGIWIQTKETKNGKQANFICNKCKAYSCQAKYCHTQRKRREREEEERRKEFIKGEIIEENERSI